MFPIHRAASTAAELSPVMQKLTFEVQGQKATSTSTVELYDFGTEVDVAAPPAAEVQDGTEVLKSFG